ELGPERRFRLAASGRGRARGLTALRIALLGLGRMGRVHLDAVAAAPLLELQAVAEERPEVAAELAPSLGGARIYASAEAALADPDVEACLVVTPTDTHAL